MSIEKVPIISAVNVETGVVGYVRCPSCDAKLKVTREDEECAGYGGVVLTFVCGVLLVGIVVGLFAWAL